LNTSLQIADLVYQCILAHDTQNTLKFRVNVLVTLLNKRETSHFCVLGKFKQFCTLDKFRDLETPTQPMTKTKKQTSDDKFYNLLL